MTPRELAIYELTAPGEVFELETVVVHGHPVRTFKNAPKTLVDMWRQTSSRGDLDYFRFADEVLTYESAHQQVASVAQWLQSRGVQQGDRVAIGMRNYPEWVLAHWAIQSLGAITVSINAWWIADELRYALSDSGTSVVIVDGERLERLSDTLLADVGIHSTVVVRAEPRRGTFAWSDIASDASAKLPSVDISPDDDATILYTSGTTGFPKGAAGSHRNYMTNVWNGLFATAVATKLAGGKVGFPSMPEKRPVVLSTFPYFHIAGLCGVTTQTYNGGIIVSQFKWDPVEALGLIQKHKITSFGGVPTVVRSLLEHPRLKEFDISSLGAISQGGAPVAPDSIARIESEFSGKVLPGNGYGLTETTAAVIGNSGAMYFQKKDSVGLPYVGTDIRIVAEDGTDCAVGAIGEVWIYGPNNVRGYWNKPEETAKAFINGWFRSGDAGFIDDDGFVYVVDRIKDMVLRGGENVYCVEVETVLFESDIVQDCAVIGIPHPSLGEEVAAVVIASPDHGPQDESALREFLQQRLASYKVPSRIFWHAGELPRNATGKVLKKDLREMYTK